MHCLVTAGATIEPIDEVRLLTNRSTGRLGCMLADALSQANHKVTLLLSESAQKRPSSKDIQIHPFTTTDSLQRQIIDKSKTEVAAFFHVAAVSDFRPEAPRKGKVDSNTPHTLQLVPTTKIIKSLRKIFPSTLLIGWKYEAEGTLDSIRTKGVKQMEQCKTDGCVLNGPAYGTGYGLLREKVHHCNSEHELFTRLITLLP